jgi:hypothetical protein
VGIDGPFGPHAFGQRERVVWCANDGGGAFAAPRALRTASGADLGWQGEARACALADWDGDGRLDLLLALPALVVHRGTAEGFAAPPEALGIATAGFAVADWNGDGTPDLILVAGEDVVVRVRTQGGFAAAESVARIAGDTCQVRLAAGDWDGDGRVDLLIGENLAVPAPAVDPAAAADDAERERAATRVLDLIRDERARLDRSAPPLRDPDAMARRAQRRVELEAWAAGPRAVLDELRSRAPGARSAGAVRVVMRS